MPDNIPEEGVAGAIVFAVVFLLLMIGGIEFGKAISIAFIFGVGTVVIFPFLK